MTAALIVLAFAVVLAAIGILTCVGGTKTRRQRSWDAFCDSYGFDNQEKKKDPFLSRVRRPVRVVWRRDFAIDDPQRSLEVLAAYETELDESTRLISELFPEAR